MCATILCMDIFCKIEQVYECTIQELMCYNEYLQRRIFWSEIWVLSRAKRWISKIYEIIETSIKNSKILYIFRTNKKIAK